VSASEARSWGRSVSDVAPPFVKTVNFLPSWPLVPRLRTQVALQQGQSDVVLEDQRHGGRARRLAGGGPAHRPTAGRPAARPDPGCGAHRAAGGRHDATAEPHAGSRSPHLPGSGGRGLQPARRRGVPGSRARVWDRRRGQCRGAGAAGARALGPGQPPVARPAGQALRTSPPSPGRRGRQRSATPFSGSPTPSSAIWLPGGSPRCATSWRRTSGGCAAPWRARTTCWSWPASPRG
jgi:hypothetical protein